MKGGDQLAYIELKHVSKYYGEGKNKTAANKDMNFEIEEKEFTVIVGPSGAGKSTVLNLLGGMDSPDEGEIIIDGKNIATYKPKELTKYRREDVGFIFQNYNLIPNLSAKENVEMATEIANNPLNPVEILESVGLGHRLDNFPAQLSGGEQQRVAIARAIATQPKLLLCDEPTGALDYETGKRVLSELHAAIQNYNATVIVITHNRAIADMADRIIDIQDASVRNMEVNPQPSPIEEIEW